MISCQGITKSYKNVQALKSVSINCEKGEIHGLVGANGAGKSTLFKIILGLVKPDSGSISFQGKGVKKIGGIIEKPALYSYLNAAENIKYFAKIQGADHSKEAINQSLEMVGLPVDRNDPIRNFSMGMKQRLGIAVALLNKPSGLLLDEPFSGLDPMGIEKLKELIVELASKQQMTILISSHIIDVLSTLCTELSIIHKGEILKTGKSTAILSDCTSKYLLCGEHLDKAKILAAYGAILIENCATVSVSSDEISNILIELANEKIKITTCRPLYDLSKVLN